MGIIKRGYSLQFARRPPRFNTGWGALCEGKPTFGHWSKAEKGFHINCLEMLAVFRACQFFLPDLIGRHVLIRSDNMSVVSYINHQGGVTSKRLFILAERLLEWAQLNLLSLRAAHPAGQTEPRSGYVISEQCPLRGVDAPSAGGSEDLEDLWQGRSRPFRLQRQPLTAQLIIRRTGTRWPTTGPTSSFMHSPDHPASTGRQACQGTGSQGAIGGPPCGGNQPWLSELTSATDSSPLARAPETGSPLSGEWNNMAPLDPSCGLSTFGRSTGAYWPSQSEC